MNIIKEEVILNCHVDKLWDLLTNLDNQLWRRNIEKVEQIDQHRFVEYDKEGIKTEFVILNKINNEVYEFNLMNENIEGHWIGKIKVLDDYQVHLEMTEAIDTRKKMMKFVVKKYLQKQQKEYIEDLKKALEH